MAKKPTKPPSKQTSSTISSIASKGLQKPGSLTNAEIRKLAGSALSQDETKGQKPKK